LEINTVKARIELWSAPTNQGARLARGWGLDQRIQGVREDAREDRAVNSLFRNQQLLV